MLIVRCDAVRLMKKWKRAENLKFICGEFKYAIDFFKKSWYVTQIYKDRCHSLLRYQVVHRSSNDMSSDPWNKDEQYYTVLCAM